MTDSTWHETEVPAFRVTNEDVSPVVGVLTGLASVLEQYSRPSKFMVCLAKPRPISRLQPQPRWLFFKI